jgi:flagellar biosynthesis protein
MAETPQKAAALQYNKEKDAAPRLTARGHGSVAEKIVALAHQHGIPIHSDADLIEVLDRVEIDTEIPLEVYAVVAEVFAFLYKVNAAKAGQGMQSASLIS